MPLSNEEKKEHGDNARKEVLNILSSCKENGNIRTFMPNFRIGRTGYKNDSQFLAPFLITFKNGERWIVYTTTSMRSDRIKGQQWDASNIKAVVPSVTKAYLCYPDGVEGRDLTGFIDMSKRFKSSEDYSAIDEILSFRQLKRNIIEHENTLYTLSKKENPKSYFDTINEFQDSSGRLSLVSESSESYGENRSTLKGRYLDLQGKDFEKMVVCAMSSRTNLMKWKDLTKTEIGEEYDVFSKIVSFLNLSKNDVDFFSATSNYEDIGFLPSGGQPKTDVIVTAYFKDKSYKNYTISCKNSSKDSVSVHQYSAASFANVLNPDDTELADLLKKFQAVGSLSAFGNENIQKLDTALTPYREKLFLWVLGGIDGDGNPDTQWAEYLLVLDNRTNTLKMHSVYDYYDYLISQGVHGAFGTPFSWTYASGQRGRSIQLKCKII